MTDRLKEADLRARIRAIAPDIVGTTAITPAIYKAERVLEIAREECPRAVTVLGGVHGTFLYRQVLIEAPWIDAVVRREGEAVFLDLLRAVEDGRWNGDRGTVRGIATRIDGRIVATPVAPRSRTSTRSSPTGAFPTGQRTPIFRSRLGAPSRISPGAAPSPVAFLPSGSSSAIIVFVIRSRSSRKSRRWSETTKSVSSSSPTKSRPFIARRSSRSAKSSFVVTWTSSGALIPGPPTFSATKPSCHSIERPGSSTSPLAQRPLRS